MMPIPTHLTDSVVPKDSKLDEKPLEATVQCPCGSQRFELFYPGQTHEYGAKLIPCTAEVDGKFFFLIKARCLSCGKVHLLFDKDFHGWDGFVCHKPNQAALDRPPLTAWKCLGCGKAEHKASVRISTQGREDFVDETDGKYDEARWPDGFCYFMMGIECCACGFQTPEWISYETM